MYRWSMEVSFYTFKDRKKLIFDVLVSVVMELGLI